MQHNVKSKIHVYIIVVIIIVSVCFMVYRQKAGAPTIYRAYTAPLSDAVYPANYNQHQASAWLGVYNQQLYFYPHCHYASKKTVYDGWLCALKSSGIVKLCELGNGAEVHIIGSSGRFLYYWVYNAMGEGDCLNCYDMEEQQEKVIYTGKACRMKTTVLEENGSLYIPLYVREQNAQPQYLHVTDGQVLSITDEQMTYQSGNLEYYTTAYYQDAVERVITVDQHDALHELALGPARRRTVLPCEQGFIVHNEGYSQLLYYVSPSKEMATLFEIPCMCSDSAVTMLENHIYLSFRRYEGYDDISLRRFENDTLEGTYMIDLENDSVTKISDNIYTGMYYFGGKQIYAIDDYCRIDVLNLQGEVISTIFEVK